MLPFTKFVMVYLEVFNLEVLLVWQCWYFHKTFLIFIMT